MRSTQQACVSVNRTEFHVPRHPTLSLVISRDFIVQRACAVSPSRAKNETVAARRRSIHGNHLTDVKSVRASKNGGGQHTRRSRQLDNFVNCFFFRPPTVTLSASRPGIRQQAQLAHHCLCLIHVATLHPRSVCAVLPQGFTSPHTHR